MGKFDSGNIEFNKYILLIYGAVFCLIFDNIPKYLQLNTISGGYANKLSWYFLFGLLLVALFEFFSNKFKLDYIEKNAFKYLAIFFVVIFCSNIHGLFIFPYYDELFAGPANQIEKLPVVQQFLNDLGLSVNAKGVTSLWIAARAVKSTLLNILYTFGFSIVLYHFFKKDCKLYCDLITKAIIAGVILLCVYSIVEIFYLAGNDIAKTILSFINPFLHPIAADHGWWPPLLWKGQLRSMFSEPSRMGNYLAFALPFLWARLLSLKKLSIGLVTLLTFYTFMIFLTQARTAVAMYWGIFFLYLFGIFYIRNKVLIKRFLVIIGITIISLLLSIGFINFCMPNENKDATVSSYLEDNVGSLKSATKRSNGARYALIRSNMETGLEHPVLGIGDILGSAYTVHNFNESDLANKEVQLWVSSYEKKGVLRYGLDAMNEYVTRFAHNGLLGLIAFLSPLFYILLKLINMMRKGNESTRIKILPVLVSLIGSAVAGCNGSLTLLYAYWIILPLAYAMLADKNLISHGK